jgi:uncharacterized membrane protein YphA (DoxX/SURF4 family)
MKKQYILKLGLAFTLLYAGIDSLVHMQDWIGFVPTWVSNFGISRALALHGHSFAEIILAILLLIGWKKRLVASIIALDILIIILVNGFDRSVFPVTFRDIGLLSIAVYLALEETV